MTLHRRKMKSGKPGTASGADLASTFEQMMQQLMLLGHTLPSSAAYFTPQQLKILFTLDFLDEPTPMSKLSSRLGVTPGTLTKTAAGLLRKNYLERQRSPDDDRVVRVSLSKEGRRAVSKIKEYRQGFFTKLCVSLTQSECRRLVESHRFILETYRRILQERR